MTQIQGQSHFLSLALVLNSVLPPCLCTFNLTELLWKSAQCELTFPPLQNRFSGKQIKRKKKLGTNTEENGGGLKRMSGDAAILTCD